MRILRIDPDLDIVEMEAELSEWMTDDVIWDAAMIGEGHAGWVSDTGMYDAGGTYAIVSGQRLPLPAYIAGVDGERTVSATMTIDELKALIG